VTAQNRFYLFDSCRRFQYNADIGGARGSLAIQVGSVLRQK